MSWIDDAKGLLQGSDYLGVNLLEWGFLIGVTFLIWTGLCFLKKKFAKKISRVAMRTSRQWDDILGRMIDKAHGLFLFVVSLYLTASMMGLDPKALGLMYKFLVVTMFFQAALWGNEILAYVLGRYLRRRYGQTDDKIDNLSTYSAIDITAKFVLWVVLFLLLLDNLGVNITALVTGLGIGGIAIALAVQNILGDIFASLTIVLDGPFEVGDYIVADDKSGTVEAIGLKTSRIRALSGEQLVFPNKKLIEGYIQNFKRMQERRVVFNFNLEYGTTVENLKRVPEIITEIVKAQDKTIFDRAHFAKLGSNALEFEVVYKMAVPDYNTFMDTQQRILIEFYRRCEEIGAKFSVPAPTVLIQNGRLIDPEQDSSEGKIIPKKRLDQ
jgi:small-conductance mechanosensitive channel